MLVDPDEIGQAFFHIDDLTTIRLQDENWDRLRHAVALIIDLFGCPIDKKEPIHRDDLLSMKKLQSEGALEE